MKLGEIKLETLYLCFATPELSIDTEDATVFSDTLNALKSDSNYSDYLNASVGAINRALSYFELKGMVPVKRAEIPFDSSEVVNGCFTMDLPRIIPDFCSLVSLSEANSDIVSYVEYAQDGALIRAFPPTVGNGYTVQYIPTLERITHATSEEYDIPLPRYMCEAIPYFVKGDIMRVDNPEEAERAREEFYSLCREMPINGEDKIFQVRTLYGMV